MMTNNKRRSELSLIALSTLLVLAASGCQRGQEGQGNPPQTADDVADEPETPADAGGGAADGGASILEERAVEIARELAAQEGYDLSIYELRGAELRDGASWWIDFEQAPPTPPGGHFSVTVDATTGEAQLLRGE